MFKKALVLTALAFATAVGTAPAAHANGSGCNSLDNGRLCLVVNGTGAGVSYTKTGGDEIVGQIGLDGGGRRYVSPVFRLKSGQGVKAGATFPCGTEVVGWLEVQGGRRYQIGPRTAC